jgi:hypothetical protein
MPPPKDWKAGNPSDFCNPANDNLRGPWPLIPFPEGTPSTVADTIQTTTSINTSPRTLKGNVALVAYGIVASIVMISWVYLIGMTLLGAVKWGLKL